jgi:hypothetical protein
MQWRDGRAPWRLGYEQDCPQIEATSLTHSRSHDVEQQYASDAQILVAHASHADVRLTPTVQMGCAHATAQVCWQIDATSPTQMLSHELLQQNESAAQILVTHGSQPETSLLPCAQMPWAQTPTSTQAPPLQVWPLAQATQALPAAPHAVAVVPAWQAPLPSTQPLHTQAPLLHAWFAAQATQALPPVPHALAVVPAWQLPLPATQPLHTIVWQLPLVQV